MKNKLIRIAPILLIIVIAVLAIAALVSLGQMFFNGGDNQNKAQVSETEAASDNLLKNDVSRSVKMIVRGPIVADENFRSYTVEVTPSARTLTTYKGYLGDVIDQVKLDNNAKSYDEFIHALDKANMMKGTALTGEEDNMLGVCATGHLYDFAILKDNNVEKHLWTSTCSGSKGSLEANVRQLQNLFIVQIPNNNQIVNDLGMANIQLMPKALIFDCFGVLVEPSLGYLKSLAETTEQSQQVSDFNLQADLGYISRQTLLENLSQVLDIPADEVWAIMQQRRLKMPKTIDFLLSKKANGSKIGLLSNVAQDTLETIFPKDELDAMFDEMILSYDTHLVKPDPKIYLLMADKLGVDPSRCVMIDDAVENITGAKSSGMQGVVFKDVDQLESDLSKLGFQVIKTTIYGLCFMI